MRPNPRDRISAPGLGNTTNLLRDIYVHRGHANTFWRRVIYFYNSGVNRSWLDGSSAAVFGVGGLVWITKYDLWDTTEWTRHSTRMFRFSLRVRFGRVDQRCEIGHKFLSFLVIPWICKYLDGFAPLGLLTSLTIIQMGLRRRVRLRFFITFPS